MVEEVEVDDAVKAVMRYERYLFRRALGVSFITNGLVIPLIVYLNLNAQIFASMLGVTSSLFLRGSVGAVLASGLAVILLQFTRASILTSRMNETSHWKHMPHMILTFSIWFTAYYLTRYSPEGYQTPMILLAGGFSSLISYFLWKTVSDHSVFSELKLVGLCLISASFVSLLIPSSMKDLVSFVFLGLIFILVGVDSMRKAQELLTIDDN